ncbi:MAG: TonB-dependent receptor plug domain-containing protein [Longimicrobiales bacterium]|nr:TonB-dependent receptor plug domain-containing protein [Longimicrobiales bacterium]
MNTAFKGAALALSFGLIQACGGGANVPSAAPTPENQGIGGYGQQPAEKIAGAVESLGSEEESGGSFATMVDMLRGRVAGLQISEGSSGEISIRIRGDQSILFNTEPLLVVDGVSVPAYGFSSTLRSMDPRDVRSIQVLKDAGSTSGYGSRGAHGVILITLKRR